MKIYMLPLLVACATEAPVLTFSIETQPTKADDATTLRSRAWEPLGIVQVDAGADVRVLASFADEIIEDGVSVDGMARRRERTIVIRRDLPPFRFAVIVAHELGHVVLDTAQHGSCGIMGGSDVVPCEDDYRIACEDAGLCRD